MTEKEHHGRHGVRTSRQTPQLHQSSLICYLHWTFLSPSDSRMMYLRLTLSTTSSPRKGTGFPGKSKVVCLQVEVVARRQYDRKARKSLHVRIKNLLHHSRGLLHFTEIQAKWRYSAERWPTRLGFYPIFLSVESKWYESFHWQSLDSMKFRHCGDGIQNRKSRLGSLHHPQPAHCVQWKWDKNLLQLSNFWQRGYNKGNGGNQKVPVELIGKHVDIAIPRT